MNIHLVAAALPPRLDGIGDYTANLAAALAAARAGEDRVTVLVGQKTAARVPGVAVESGFCARRPRSLRRLREHVGGEGANAPDWLLLQYNPFSYGRWGLNPYLAPAVRAVQERARAAGGRTRFALMVHEPFVRALSPKTAVMALWQRAQLRRLGRLADVVFFSIEPWRARFAGWFPGTPVHHLPVGSNIARCSTAAAPKKGGGDELVVGLFGTAHHARLLDRVRAAAEAIGRTGQRACVVYVGPDGAAVRTALANAAPLWDRGVLPPAEVSRAFAAMDLYLAPFVDGVSTRRTSLMTGLQHGVAIIGTHGVSTDPLLRAQHERALLLAPANDSNAFAALAVRAAGDHALRARLGREARQLYEQNFAWECVASRLRAALVAAEKGQPL